ncbi:MAG TPA: c-type cytochrome [Gaiellaceae bacterium]|nr:c-type cytochrome [Gaiellaceae bacterium]
MKRSLPAWSALGLVSAFTVTVGVPGAALAHPDAAPKIVGNAKSGKPVFQTTCGVCHRLKAAGSVGNIGPDLNKVSLSEVVIIKAITNGGATVMSKVQAAKYTTQMTAYRNALTTARIQDIAAFVYTSTHPK